MSRVVKAKGLKQTSVKQKMDGGIVRAQYKYCTTLLWRLKHNDLQKASKYLPVDKIYTYRTWQSETCRHVASSATTMYENQIANIINLVDLQRRRISLLQGLFL
jgi:hypothetical protein